MLQVIIAESTRHTLSDAPTKVSKHLGNYRPAALHKVEMLVLAALISIASGRETTEVAVGKLADSIPTDEIDRCLPMELEWFSG